MILEWLLERRNPGPLGDVDVGAPEEGRVPRWYRIARFILATVIVVTAVRLIADSTSPVMASLAFAAYLIAGYVVHPKPDTSDTGILGFIDHPFKWSDDVNRLLLTLQLLLFPGRITATAIRDLLGLAVGRRRLRGSESPR